MIPHPSSPEFFEAKYRDRDDPWAFATDDYERRRYDAVLAQVPAGAYRRAFEPGCSVGVLTRDLAERCASVDATDVAPTAVARARQRCHGLPGVDVRVGGLGPPDGRSYDLIVFSEVGYYQPEETLEPAIRRLARSVEPGGRFVASHWLGRSDDHVLHASEVHRVVGAVLADWSHRTGSVHRDARRDGFVLDVWDRP